MKNKTAVIIYNLGGPGDIWSVKSFLFNLFYDKYIIDMINPFRWVLAKLISTFREKKSQNIYRNIGGRSPILENTYKQAERIEEKLKLAGDYKVYVAMRYSKPFIKDIVEYITKSDFNEIIAIPLYPQLSISTTVSSVKEITDNLKVKINTKILCCYPREEDFIASHVNLIKEAIKKLKTKKYRIIFTAHGIPIKMVEKGDPYQWQTEESVKHIVKKLNIKNLDYIVSYQSKVGPMKWLEPNTENEIIKACKEEKEIILVPISFVSEHSETLYELDIQYLEIAKEHNCINYIRVPTLSEDENFINSLLKAILELSKKEMDDKNILITSSEGRAICPPEFKQCLCRE